MNKYVSGGGKHRRQKTRGKEQGERRSKELVFYRELSGKTSQKSHI